MKGGMHIGIFDNKQKKKKVNKKENVHEEKKDKERRDFVENKGDY